jgi:sec-independent protein translocase protein TatB
MNFLGIGPGEIFLILIVLLVVVGPQRLPDFARQAGRLLVRVRNWVQTSPDAAMVLRARQELEQELASIRTSLMEVQSVRDEVLGAAKQLEESVNTLASNTKLEINNAINPPTSIPQTSYPNWPNKAQDTPSQADDLLAEPASDQVPSEIKIEIPDVGFDTAAEAVETAPAAATAPALTPSEAEELNLRLQAVMADLWALQEQLRQRGLLDADWQPPSFTMHLPDGPPAPPNGQIEEVP